VIGLALLVGGVIGLLAGYVIGAREANADFRSIGTVRTAGGEWLEDVYQRVDDELDPIAAERVF
jgi:hypothetical protein